MAKRRATAQLTKENCEDEEIEEDSGEFRKADDQELANRPIRIAKRRSSNAASPLANFAGFGSVSNNSSFSFLKKPDAVNPPAGNAVPPSEMLKTLNLSFSKWIQQHLDKNPYVVLLPVFKDYEKHFTSLKLEQPSGNEHSSTSQITPPVADPPTFKFFTNTTTATTTAPRVGSGLFNFSANDSKPDKAETSAAPKPNFNFGTSLSEQPKTSGFTFDLNNSSKPSFSTKVAESNPNSNDNETNNEEPSDEPPAFDFVPPGEEGSSFEMRCKVFFKKDGSFASIGVGTLFLKPIAGGKTQLITRADTSQGSVLLNLILTPDLPLQKTGKNNVLLVCVPTPEAQPPPCPVLIRVKSEEERDQLFNEMERLRSSA